jgi:hypothetical protein
MLCHLAHAEFSIISESFGLFNFCKSVDNSFASHLSSAAYVSMDS